MHATCQNSHGGPRWGATYDRHVARWVCRRCFESNEESVHACAKCGLLRGALPSPGEQAALPGGAAPARAGLGGLLPLLGRFWWVLALVVVGIGGYVFNAQRGEDGAIERGGSMSITDLRVGDCFSLDDDAATEVEEVSAKPCAEPHGFEMIYVGTFGASGDAFPGAAAFEAFVGDRCLSAFTDFVGLGYPESRLELSWFEPTVESWGLGDRTVQCAILDPVVPELTESMRNALR